MASSLSLEDMGRTPIRRNITGPQKDEKGTSIVSVSQFSNTRPRATTHNNNPRGNQEQENHNPQDATMLGVSKDVVDTQEKVQREATTSNGKYRNKTNRSQPEKLSNRTTTGKWKRRKRGRYVRVATVDDKTDSKHASIPPLPQNQYYATLRRRAIRKRDEGVKRDPATAPSEDYGDTSLGMKLIFDGGRAIVQNLIPLADGRASPAQLAGVIHPGDVLLSIDNVSLVALPPDQLMEGLKPLSEPGKDGSYQRVLTLRFESGKGVDVVKNHESGDAWKKPARSIVPEGMDAANEMFSLFPMVDQLSGTPFFEDQTIEERQQHLQDFPKKSIDVESPPSTPCVPEEPEEEKIVSQPKTDHPDELISEALAEQRKRDRERFSSEFFIWNDQIAQWLRSTVRTLNHTKGKAPAGPSHAERVEKGLQVMEGAKVLSFSLEQIDRGKDMRSFRRWNTTLSLRSRASTRRRHLIDSVSLPAHRLELGGHASDDDTMESGESGSFDGIDADELLLGLAAHDGIWRKQVADALEKAIRDMENEAIVEKEEPKPQVAQDIDSAITMELGTFLFGENMTRIITKRKKSRALPPEEITSVLFDLTTNIASSAPDEITVVGQASANSGFRSSSVAFPKPKQSSQGGDVILASLFLLNEALPLWLKTFRPLPWDQRRVLWPRNRQSAVDSNCGTNTVFSDDSLTVGSAGSARSPPMKKNLREMIEDQELDMETRAETCYLASYYCTQQLVTAFVANEDENILVTMREFIKKYGAYLNLHSCLAASALARAEPVINELLLVAEHDPSHRDATREILRHAGLTFYDVSKLSALVKYLSIFRYEASAERRRLVINLCASAYPDVQPWQVKQACIESLDKIPAGADASKAVSSQVLADHFYTYLSQLLYPLEGHDVARHDQVLVKEWCERSVSSQPAETSKQRLENFFNVASRPSSRHPVYYRDLVLLLNLSMSISEHDLALDLAGEILDNESLSSTKEVLDVVLRALRDVALKSLSLANTEEQRDVGFHCLKRVLRLYDKMSKSESSQCRNSLVVAHELHSLLNYWRTLSKTALDTAKLFVLVDFFVAASAPRDFLDAFVLWCNENEVGPIVLPRLKKLLLRGVQVSLQNELSGSLLRLKYARSIEEVDKPAQNATSTTARGIWARLSAGETSVNK